MKKRILFIHHGVGIGGAPHSLLLLIKVLDRSLYDPLVLFLFDSPAIDLFRKAEIPVVGPVLCCEFSHTQIWWYRWYHAHHFLRALWDWMMVFLFDAHIWFNRIKPDIVHLNTSSLSAWALAAWWKNIPVVWHIRESLAEGYFGIRCALIQFFVARCATKILAITKFDGRFWQGSPKLEILYNVVDTDVFVPDREQREIWRDAHKIPQDAKILLYLGGLSREKGALQALQLLKNMKARGHSTMYLVIASAWHVPETSFWRRVLGRDAWYRQVGGLVEELKDSLIFTGPLPSALRAIQAADCLLFPATKGHAARPVIEAGAVGVPVLVSNLPPLDELVLDGVTGFLCPPDDQQQWASRCEQLLKRDPDKKQDSRAFVEERFSLRAYADCARGIYKGL